MKVTDLNYYHDVIDRLRDPKLKLRRFEVEVGGFLDYLRGKDKQPVTVDLHRQAMMEDEISKIIQGKLKRFHGCLEEGQLLLSQVQEIKEVCNKNYKDNLKYVDIPFNFSFCFEGVSLKDFNLTLFMKTKMRYPCKKDLLSMFPVQATNGKQERVMPKSLGITTRIMELQAAEMNYFKSKEDYCHHLAYFKSDWKLISYMTDRKNSLLDSAILSYLEGDYLLTLICLTTFWEAVQEDICIGIYEVNDKNLLKENPSLKGEVLRKGLNCIFSNSTSSDIELPMLLGYFLDSVEIDGQKTGLNLRNYVAHGDLDNLEREEEAYSGGLLYLTILFLKVSADLIKSKSD